MRYATDDGVDLVAWWFPAVGQPKGSVVVFPGNAGNRADRVPLAGALSSLGYATLLVDYRGYGGNSGSPSEVGLAHDARAALRYLHSRDDVDPSRVVYFGESLGSGVAIQLATETSPAALILRSPFTSLSDVGSVQFRLLPVSMLLKDRFDNATKIGAVDSPVLVIAGTHDDLVPMEMSRKLFARGNDPKELVLIDGAGHNDAALLSGSELTNAIDRFLQASLGDP